ncbi:hypothetical protein BCY84_11963 [Trypanosoma cruzi cruzi]|nr:hypothetical protein BCY84_11963 [Trypanosoma cruzi cruzi]
MVCPFKLVVRVVLLATVCKVLLDAYGSCKETESCDDDFSGKKTDKKSQDLPMVE